jgi:hypothetical protein
VSNTSVYGCFVMTCQIEEIGVAQTFVVPFFSTVSEQLSITNNVPKHPLDNGLFVNDHVNHEPDSFDVAFNVAESQIGQQAVALATFRRVAQSTEETLLRTIDGVETAYSTLIFDNDILSAKPGVRTAAYERVLMKYRNFKWELHTTRHGVLDDYMITSVSFNAGDASRSIEVRINFQKVRFASASSVLLSTVPQAVKAAATAAGRSKAPGGMQISKMDLGGGFDMDWGLGGVLNQVGSRSLARDLWYGNVGQPQPDEFGQFEESLPEIDLGVSPVE